jgi:hypothetical protein
MIKHVVLYAVVTDHDEAGIFVDAYFLGGIIDEYTVAEKLAWDLTNDKTIPGTVLTKIYKFNNHIEFERALVMAGKYFHQLALDMYDAEEVQKKSKNRD